MTTDGGGAAAAHVYSGRMFGLFDILGILLGAYVVYALLNRSVYAKSGVWGRTFRRDEEAWGYWSAIVAYVLLSIALVFVF